MEGSIRAVGDNRPYLAGADGQGKAGACGVGRGKHIQDMSRLAEVENAAGSLALEEQRELFLFLLERLRSQGAPMPEPRTFSREQMAGWIREDDEDMQRFRAAR